MSSLQRFAANYLHFTTKEKTGIFGLLVVIGFVHFLPDFLDNNKDYSKELQQFKMEIAAFQSMDTSSNDAPLHQISKSAHQVLQPFYFDPNTVDPKHLSAFGLNSKLIERFAKYRNAGARFYKKEDMNKIYGMNQDFYSRMEPYILFEQKNAFQVKEKVSETSFERQVKVKQPVELNSADSMTLLEVKGIGPYMCSKILKYRKALGGFCKFEQLLEIYGLKAEQIEPLRLLVVINSNAIIKLDINMADYESLNAHPYISAKEAKAIINYRKHHGSFKDMRDLEKIVLIEKSTLDKLHPYLAF